MGRACDNEKASLLIYNEKQNHQGTLSTGVPVPAPLVHMADLSARFLGDDLIRREAEQWELVCDMTVEWHQVRPAPRLSRRSVGTSREAGSWGSSLPGPGSAPFFVLP